MMKNRRSLKTEVFESHFMSHGRDQCGLSNRDVLKNIDCELLPTFHWISQPAFTWSTFNIVGIKLDLT